MKRLLPVGIGPLRLGAAERFALRVALLFGVFGVAWIFLSDHLVNARLVPLDAAAVQTFKGLLFVALSASLIFAVSRHGYRSLAFVAQRLADVQRLSHTGDWSLDTGTGEIRASDELHRIYGREPQDGPLSSEVMHDAIHAEDREWVVETISAGMASVSEYEVEHRIVRPDGSVRFVHSRGEPWWRADGSVGGICGTVHDITVRHEAEAALRRRVEIEGALARISSVLASGAADALDQTLQVIGPLLATSRAGIYLFSDDRRSLAAAHEWCAPGVASLRSRLQGVPVERLPWWLGQVNAGDAIRYADVDELPDSAQKEKAFFVAHGVRSVVALPLEGRDPVSGFLGLHSHAPRRWTDPEIELLRLVARTVATELERRRAEERLRFLSRAVEQSPASIMITDLTGAIVYVNPKFCAVTGYRSDEVLGRNPRLLQSGVHPPSFYEELWRTITAGQEWRGELRNRRKSGETFLEVVAISPVVGMDGEVTHFVAVKEDVTESRVLQKKFEESQKMEAVGRLAGGIAHDFNNVLTAIGGHARLMLDEVTPTHPLRDDVEEIVSASDRAAGVIRQLLLFSRRASSNPTVVDLKHAVDGIRRMLKRLLGEDVRLLVEAVGEASAVRADRSQIDQILMNLVINARDAMPAGGTLQIQLERVELRPEDVEEREALRPGPHVRLSVADTGTGIEPEVQEHLFEPFFTTKDPGKGTGLGLATVFGMVRENDGHIEVQSDLGRGSTFTIYFPEVPLLSTGPVMGPPGEAGAPGGSEPESTDRAPVVLVAEDESAVRALVRRVLIRQGYEVLEACDGAEAEYVSDTYNGRIDLLLTDTVMPGLRGPEVARRLNMSRPELSILFMSGYTFDEATVHTIPDGAPFLAKPFTPEALHRAVQDALVAGKTSSSG